MTRTTEAILAALRPSARSAGGGLELPLAPEVYSRAAIEEARAACAGQVHVESVPGATSTWLIKPASRLEPFLRALLEATVRNLG